MEENVIYRKIKTEDLVLIEDLQRKNIEEINNIWTKLDIDLFLNKRESYNLISYYDNEILGFILTLNVSGNLEIYIIFICPQHRRKGIASELMKKCINHCKKFSIKKILLEVNENNKAAISFYQKLNFKKIGLRKDYYFMNGSRQNAQVMELII